jgi:hypothetical protein
MGKEGSRVFRDYKFLYRQWRANNPLDPDNPPPRWSKFASNRTAAYDFHIRAELNYLVEEEAGMEVGLPIFERRASENSDDEVEP